MVTFLPATKDDFDFFYNLKCEDENIHWSGFKGKPEVKKLKEIFDKWVDEMDEPDKRQVYFIYYSNNKAGYLVYSFPVDSDEAELLVVAVSSIYSGKGIGSRAYAEAIRAAGVEGKRAIFGYVREDHSKSIHIFKKNGFHEDKDGSIYRAAESNQEEVKMLKFTYELI